MVISAPRTVQVVYANSVTLNHELCGRIGKPLRS